MYLLSWLLITLISGSSGFGLGLPSSGPLYTSSDHVRLLNVTNFSGSVTGSDRAWLVEFYSSWCGHCIHFAPEFKKLANDVKGWHSVIDVAVLDCADEANIPVCRDYEVMGYPTLKFFTPGAEQGNIGEERQSHNKEVEVIKADMVTFVAKVANNKSFADFTERWPQFKSLKSSDLQDLWSSSATFASSPYAIVVYDLETSPMAFEILLDLSELSTKNSPIPIRRVAAKEASVSLVQKLGVENSNPVPQVLVVSRSDLTVHNLTPNPIESRSSYVEAVKSFLSQNKPNQVHKEPEVVIPQEHKEHNPQMVHTEADVKRRRYTVFMSDLENAILYAIGHEVAQHSVITGNALNALQNFIDVLSKHFPSRTKTKHFLSEIRSWVLSHDDAIRGEDLSKRVEQLMGETGAFTDIKRNEYIGCKGSENKYGGYPCSLWMLWHTLTVNYANGGSPETSTIVLDAMVDYIKEFFGCRECARHFLQMAEDGEAIKREINTPEEAILWLWKAHNKVNIRLSGDISDDPLFPKEKYPNRQHCTDCYNARVGGADLWTEFRLKFVENFLKEMYGSDTISMQGLQDSHVDNPAASHGLIIVNGRKNDEVKNVHNWNRDQGKTWTGSFFSPMDMSLCFSVYLLSACMLLLCYLKFIAKKRFSSIISGVCPRSRSTHNPLLGKV